MIDLAAGTLSVGPDTRVVVNGEVQDRLATRPRHLPPGSTNTQHLLGVGGHPWPTTLRRAALTRHPAGTSFGDPEPIPQHHHGPAATVGAHQLPLLSSLSMSISSS